MTPPPIFKKDYEKSKHFQNLTLPNFQMKFFPSGFVLFSVNKNVIREIKYNIFTLIICNIMFCVNIAHADHEKYVRK